MFQARFPDGDGQPLKIDGVVGTITWEAMFGEGEGAAPAEEAALELCGAALGVARTQIGVREDPPGSNNGREVAAYLDAVGLPPGNAWCAAFVWKKDDSDLGKRCPTERDFRKVESDAVAGLLPHVRAEVEQRLAAGIQRGNALTVTSSGHGCARSCSRPPSRVIASRMSRYTRPCGASGSPRSRLAGSRFRRMPRVRAWKISRACARRPVSHITATHAPAEQLATPTRRGRSDAAHTFISPSW